MNRASIFQAATVAVLIGVMILLLGGITERRATPQHPTMTLRPATDQERRQSDRDRLAEEMLRYRQQQQAR